MKRIFTRIIELSVRLSARLRSMATGIKEAVQRRARILSPEGNLRLVSLSDYLHQLKAEPQRGSINAGFIETLFVGVILLVVMITFLWQQGIPEIISATSNTSAMTAAGADAATVNWASFIGKAVVIFLLIAALIVAARMARGGGSATGSIRRRVRRSRR